MNASIPIDNPQRKALETIATIAQLALGRHHKGPVLRSLFDPEIALTAGAEPVLPPPAVRAKALYAARRRRDRVFGDHAELLADPVWDLLLDLFAAHYEGRTVSVSSACLAACVAPTTALRWIVTLERRNLVERVPDTQDRRRCFVTLSAEGLALVEHAITQI